MLYVPIGTVIVSGTLIRHRMRSGIRAVGEIKEGYNRVKIRSDTTPVNYIATLHCRDISTQDLVVICMVYHFDGGGGIAITRIAPVPGHLISLLAIIVHIEVPSFSHDRSGGSNSCAQVHGGTRWRDLVLVPVNLCQVDCAGHVQRGPDGRYRCRCRP